MRMSDWSSDVCSSDLLSLGRVERLLARLDQPETRLAPVVHVAGTNGKGSLLAFLRAMLEAAGRRVQAYTSPHLVRFHERIRLTSGLIDEAALIALLERFEETNGPEPITFRSERRRGGKEFVMPGKSRGSPFS